MTTLQTPHVCLPLTVLPEWIDLYGHMNASAYVRVFDHHGYQLLGTLGVGEAYTQSRQCGIYTVELRVRYYRELKEGTPIELRLHLLGADEKRVHCLMELYRTDNGTLAATMEQLSVHVDLTTRRARPFPNDIAASLAQTVHTHAGYVQGTGYEAKLSVGGKAGR